MYAIRSYYENAPHDARVDAAGVIAYPEHHPSGLPAAADVDLPAVDPVYRDGVRRVVDQVDEHLFELVSAADDGAFPGD